MTKEEILMNLDDLEYCFLNYDTVECTPIDAKTIRTVIDYIEYGLKVFTTDELMKELMRRQAILVVPKVQLDDGAVG